MIRPVHWLVAGAAAVALHAGLLGLAPTQSAVQTERSAGRAGAVWGLPVAMNADVVDPTMEPTETTDAVEPTETSDDVQDVVEDVPVEPEIADPAEVAEAVAATTPRAIDPVEPVETPEPATAEAAPEIPAPEDPATDAPMEVAAWQGGIAVTPEAVEPVEPVAAADAVEVAAVAPAAAAVQEVGAVQEIEAADAIPMPRVRPADVPRIEAPRVETPRVRTPPKPKVANKPKAVKTTKPKTAATVTQHRTSGQTARASAPAGEQVGSGGTRQGAAGRHLVSSYAGKVAAHLRRYKRYPGNAERQSGTATVTFSLSRSGGVRSARLARSSGKAAFDREVVAMVRRAAPFPPIPGALGKNSMTFTVPVRFQPR